MSERSPANESAVVLERILSLQEHVKQLAHAKSEADRAHNKATCELANLRIEFTRLVAPFIDRYTFENPSKPQRLDVIT